MSGVDTPDAGGSAKKGKKKKTKRLNIRIDMTPMVDVAFLLLTFFMLTTVFSKPQTMEINLPPDEKAEVEVAASNLMTVYVTQDGTIYWHMGDAKDNPLNKSNFKEIRSVFIERIKSNPKLITLIKVDRDAKYINMVDIMDELNLANITRFTLAKMDQKDRELTGRAGA
jgi:biopolymer transport protein ExbD